MNESDAQLFAALVDERNEYVARGLPERVAQIDEQIGKLRRSLSAAGRMLRPGTRLVEWRCPKGHMLAAVEQTAERGREFVLFATSVRTVGPTGKPREERWPGGERIPIGEMHAFDARRIICACQRPPLFAGPEAELQLREWERWSAPCTRVVILRK